MREKKRNKQRERREGDTIKRSEVRVGKRKKNNGERERVGYTCRQIKDI